MDASRSSYETVMALEDEGLLAAVAAYVELAHKLGAETDLAGHWILDGARRRVPNLWLPNFKPFVTHGLLYRVGGSRGGSRAYYRAVDLEGSERALVERGIPL
jgi:hypothetical protein